MVLVNALLPDIKQTQLDTGPTIEIGRGFAIQSTIGYSYFLKARHWFQNKSFQRHLFHIQFT